MNGANKELRWLNARKFQRVLDRTPTSQLGDQIDNLRFWDAIDDRAFGDPPGGGILLSEDANLLRDDYLTDSALSPAAFRAQLEALSQQLGRGEIPYAPPGG